MRHINLAIPEELLADVDEAASKHYMSRSDYIRAVLHRATSVKQPEAKKKYISPNTPIDEWFLDARDS